MDDDIPPAGTGQEGEPAEPHVFTLDEARALMPEVHEHVDEFVRLRADLAELAADLRVAGRSPLGGMPELKAMEARFSELHGWFPDHGIEVKNLAPVLIDFPALLDGAAVRLCWLEGEPELAWYHRSELGFIGRRRLPPS
ncbi:DUF2203 domain-containing protein [Nocardiopsis gilva YIM 90087]|uniref:DUF2203 domain-containing protein n=1 Tax=Nocardiopsis gilva YIM 90087 TaxID=1235441 RepID=A0A223S4T1_9ACTN|nr:DUF2203 domain-containing protein [Nocardiopsis gilva]ASU83150.1 DUF2203 domain-containing protein [Nocardiopsis gilva YIM 90087]